MPRIGPAPAPGPVKCRICGTLVSVQRKAGPPGVVPDDPTSQQDASFRLPGYDLLGVLGRGGMGEVFSAVRRSDRELVAIKVLPEDCAKYPELIRRFYLEAQSMAALTHPNILPVLDRGTVGRKSYIVMDYIPGCNLKQRIAEAAPMRMDEIVAIAAPVAEAIQCCHDNQFVHRDLKPANVLLSQAGRVYVTDFGIANLIPRLGDQTDHGMAIGTPQYVAPEQLADGSNVDHRADQFSLAVIIYEMLTGRLPAGRFDPPSSFRRDLTPAAEEAIMRALSGNASQRYESIRQFARAFRKGLERTESSVHPNMIRQAASSAVVDVRTLRDRPQSEDVKRLANDWVAVKWEGETPETDNFKPQPKSEIASPPAAKAEAAPRAAPAPAKTAAPLVPVDPPRSLSFYVAAAMAAVGVLALVLVALLVQYL